MDAKIISSPIRLNKPVSECVIRKTFSAGIATPTDFAVYRKGSAFVRVLWRIVIMLHLALLSQNNNSVPYPCRQTEKSWINNQANWPEQPADHSRENRNGSQNDEENSGCSRIIPAVYCTPGEGEGQATDCCRNQGKPYKPF